ncbi:PREDICTED: nardilysin-like [Acromyrmex echinatior]|uniref:nardilysin-like n=1 Tax=Acromyrmex echinatior TaxID=103372 RepID=UPI0005810B0E|nr:PREDICTED: nardilysin-like [Acromyrmex echinatior]
MSKGEITTKGYNYNITKLDSPTKSEYDKAEYRVVRLRNGLTALLISNLEEANNDDMKYKDCEEGCSSAKRVKRDVWKASCGLCVGVGSFSDPSEVSGLAHFLQRMVFIGSEKYTNEDFKGFISLHGGTTYGATDCEYTRFYFDIPETQLLSALIPFGILFDKCWIKKDAITREREIIQREFQLDSSNSEKNKKERLLSFIAKSGHPASKFLWSKSLALNNDIDDDKLYEELHKFRERHYSAHRMKLVIQARLSLDTLEMYVQTCFNSISSNWLPSDDFTEFKDGKSFDASKQMCKRIKSMEHITRLHVTWVLPSLLNLYRSKPIKYISWIIEHKGSNSLTSYLRKKMWGVFDVFCGNCDNDNDFGYNSMYVLFEIIIELTDKGLSNVTDILCAIFSFLKLIKRMGPQERKHIYFEYNPEAIQKYLDLLMPETAKIMIFDKNGGLNIVEPHFKINYRHCKLLDEYIECWKSIEPLPDFDLPSFLFQMYCNVLKYLLLEELYPAVIAGFDYEIDVNEEVTGITIQISGFNENLPLWLMVIANYMVNPVLSKDLFKIIKMQQAKAYYNKFIKPEKFIKDIELWILKSGNCTYVHKYNALHRYSLEDFQDFVKSFTNNLYFQCLVQGNVTKDFTMNIIQRFIKKIKCSYLREQEVLLTTEINYISLRTSYFKLKNMNRNDVNSIVTNYYQVGTTIESSVLIQLMLMIMKESLMNLRIQEKFSYVSCDFRDINGMLGYSITVYTQADECTTEYVDQWIEEFLNSFQIVLEQFSEKKLDDVKEGLRTSKQHDDTEILKNRVNRNWSEITKQQYMFDRYEKEALAIDNININKLREFFRKHTLNGSSFRKLSTHLVGTSKKVAVNAQIFESHHRVSFKKLIIDDSQYIRATDLHIIDVDDYKQNFIVTLKL